MENKHTPEPMFKFDFDKLARYENGRTPVLLSEEQYRRARACVNACAGINTEALEHRVHLLKAEDDQIATLTKQRDELLSALERIAAGPWDNRLLTAIQWAKEAIGNVKGTNNV